MQLDWQLAGKGDPVNDIARWLAQSISVEDRKETEQELLKLYHDKLVEHGVTGYSYKAFINGYKMNLVVILVMFSMSMESVDQSSERAQALFHQFYSRLDAALASFSSSNEVASVRTSLNRLPTAGFSSLAALPINVCRSRTLPFF